ncbi:MAG: tetratricopeptide repeat protein, partial [Acidobacteriota bacterium]
MVEALRRLGGSQVHLEDVDGAGKTLDRAAALADRLSETESSFRVAIARCIQAFSAGDIERTRQIAEDGLRRLDQVDDLSEAHRREFRRDLLVRLAQALEAAGQREEALAILLEALALTRDDRTGYGMAEIGLETAHAKIEAGDLDAGEELLTATRDLLEQRLGTDNPYYAAALSVGGVLCIRRGEVDAAKEQFGRSLAIVERVDLGVRFYSLPLLGLGMAHEAAGEIDQAVDSYFRIWELSRDRPLLLRQRLVISGLDRLIELSRDRGDTRLAAEIEERMALATPDRAIEQATTGH